MKNGFRIAGAVTVLLLASGQVLAAASPKTAPAATRTVLVGLKSGHSAKGLAAAGYKISSEWADADAVAIEVTDAEAARLAKHSDVAYVEDDVQRKALGTFSDALPITWGVQAVNAPQAWSAGATGAGVKVCVLDTGIDYGQPEFYKNGVSIIKGSKNFVKDRHPDATDGYGHGTHVAGTIAAQGVNVQGVAPDVNLYIGRVLDDTGSGTSSAILNGVNWCVNTVHANIISMSLGGTQFSRTEDRTYSNAAANGTLVIAAAGNSGDSTMNYPAGYSSVVSVAAVDSSLNHAAFSTFNSDVELSGPGVAVYSSVPRGTGRIASTAAGGTAYASNPVEYAGTGSVTGPLVDCGIADTATSCTGAPASGAWVALVNRGSVTFSTKATNVMNQGASAMILVNNDTASPDDAGSFTFGSAGNWLPTNSVSYNSGVTIHSAGLSTASVSITASDYAYESGTSMATPHVSAVAALAWSAKPSLTNSQIRTILQNSAKDLGAAGRDTYYGYGLVQADAAVTAARNTQ